MHTARIAAVVIVIALAIGVAVAARSTTAPLGSTVSTSANDWTLPRLSGTGQVALADFRGKPAVVDFFASWCTACKAELPEFLAVSHLTGARVAFVGVDSEENGDGLSMARQSGITAWPLARDVGGSQASGLRDALESTPGMPITAFYDARGHVVSVRLGALTADALRSLLHQLFAVSLP